MSSSGSGDGLELAITYFTGQTCSQSPTSIVFSPQSSCAEEIQSCTNESISSSYSVNCSTDRAVYSSNVFDSKTYLLIDEFTDDECSDYSSSQAFIMAEVCQVANSLSSVIGKVFKDGSANLAYYNDSVTCDGSMYFNMNISASDLEDHTCLSRQASGVTYFRAYTNRESRSTSESASSSRSSSLATSSTSSSASDAGEGLSSSTWSVGPVVVVSIAAGIMLLVAFLFFILRYRRRRMEISETIASNGFSDQKGGLWDDDDILASRIVRADVVIKDLINHGAFGEVYVGTFNNQTVAIKMLPREVRKSIEKVNLILSEAKLMARMDHNRIVRLIGVAWNSLSDLCVVSEFMSGGDLRALLHKYEQDPANHPIGFNFDKMKIAIHVANALVYLHSLQPKVLHRDLKSKNILLSQDLDAKLTDFGISREKVDKTMTAGVGTSLWMAPEVLVGERYDEKADIFSFGVVLAELDLHSLPYTSAKKTSAGAVKSDAAVLQLVSVGRLHVDFSDATLPSVRDLGLRCVALDPTLRPTAAEVMYQLTTIAKNELQTNIDP